MLTALFLAIAAHGQIYDSNLYQLSEVPSILNGDHPYRDFFEWGAPLTAYLSAGAQVLVGYRLIGEFAMQWTLIVIGALVSFRLALQLSGSLGAALAVLPVQLLLLLQTPTYHFLKLFVFPVMIVAAFRYLASPTIANSVLMGVGTAVGFLLRNDFGVWLGALWLLTILASTWSTTDGLRSTRLLRHSVVYGLAAAVTLGPWAALVESGEGLRRYFETRTTEFEAPGDWPFVYRRLVDPTRFPIPNLTTGGVQAGRVELEWRPDVPDESRRKLERESLLKPIGPPSANGRQHYEVANINDPEIRRLRPHIQNDTGFDWTRLKLLRSSLATPGGAVQWLQWVALLVPLVLIIQGLRRALRGRGPTDQDLEAPRYVVLGGFLVILLSVLLREPGYVVLFTPLLSAAAAALLVGTAAGPLTRAFKLALLGLTLAAAVGYSMNSVLFTTPSLVGERMTATFARLTESPPVHGELNYVYVRECTDPEDRLLITGPTPYSVSYFTRRPIAGGHFLWQYRWQSDEVGQERSLALLNRQSVPFVFSTSGSKSAFDDFESYPRIREYLARHYRELPGTNGRLLVDTRLQPTGTFGNDPLPCFAGRREQS